VLGWKPRVSLEEGLRITIEWFRDQIARGNPVVSAR
jgi:nucleoside-diphosphate-sugar epimerase